MKLYFQENDPICYDLKYHRYYMYENGINELKLYEAKREVNSPYFFCKLYERVGEKSESECGKMCEGYKPRNGVSGCCKHIGFTYEQTDNIYLLKKI